jgi:hypothetical protein
MTIWLGGSPYSDVDEQKYLDKAEETVQSWAQLMQDPRPDPSWLTQPWKRSCQN